MARGRFISNDIIIDRQVHELSSDTCRLAYTWMITFADAEGRVTGEPDLLLSALFPRRRDISPEDIQSYIDEWVAAGFIFVYEGGDGDRVIQLLNFEKHQRGLRKDREPASRFDNPADCRMIAGSIPDDCTVKLIEVNINDNNNDNEIPDARSDSADYQSVWESETGLLISGFTEFKKTCDRFIDVGVTPEIFRTAIKEQKKSEYAVKRPSGVAEWAIRLVKKVNDNDKKGNIEWAHEMESNQ